MIIVTSDKVRASIARRRSAASPGAAWPLPRFPPSDRRPIARNRRAASRAGYRSNCRCRRRRTDGATSKSAKFENAAFDVVQRVAPVGDDAKRSALVSAVTQSMALRPVRSLDQYAKSVDRPGQPSLSRSPAVTTTTRERRAGQRSLTRARPGAPQRPGRRGGWRPGAPARPSARTGRPNAIGKVRGANDGIELVRVEIQHSDLAFARHPGCSPAPNSARIDRGSGCATTMSIFIGSGAQCETKPLRTAHNLIRKWSRRLPSNVRFTDRSARGRVRWTTPWGTVNRSPLPE